MLQIKKNLVYFLTKTNISRQCIFSFYFQINCLCLTFMSEGEMTDQASCPPSSSSDPQTVISDSAVASSNSVKPKATIHLSPHSPTLRHNPFNGDSDTNTSADVTPVHVACGHGSTVGDEVENGGSVLEVIRYSSCSFVVCFSGI